MNASSRATWTTVAAIAALSALSSSRDDRETAASSEVTGARVIVAEYGSPPAPRAGRLVICSFNIQFLGQSKKRLDEPLSELLKDFDIVVVQELIGPPADGTWPGEEEKEYSANEKAKAFFDEMKAHGFKYELSKENTGRTKNHVNSSVAEWWVAFYKPKRVKVADDLPRGFLSDVLAKNDVFDRVPYAFAFRTVNENADFVLISVHLKAAQGEKAGRKAELAAIEEWIADNSEVEQDFIILGDMNIQSGKELESALPGDFLSLNSAAFPTNTNVNGPKPYDHVMFNPDFTTEVDAEFGFRVVNLVTEMKPYWPKRTGYPGKPYKHNEFRQYFSDHNPVFFQMTIPDEDDD